MKVLKDLMEDALKKSYYYELFILTAAFSTPNY